MNDIIKQLPSTAELISGRANVPCNGCKACCGMDAVILREDYGDVLDNYVYEKKVIPGWGLVPVLPKVDRHCYYLGPDGCTIHDHAPAMCRVFDCRKFYQRFTRPERRRMVREGLADQAVFDAGRQRLTDE